MRPPGRRLSVRTRLTLWYSGVLLAIVLVISAFSYFMLHRSLIRDADVQLVMVGQVIRDAGIGEAKPSEAELHQILGPEFFDISSAWPGPTARRREAPRRFAAGRFRYRSGRGSVDAPESRRSRPLRWPDANACACAC